MIEMKYRTVKEETVFVDLPNSGGLKIKAILRGSWSQPMVVLVHGRPGTGNDCLQYLAARYLYEQGLSSLRLFLYDFDVHARNLLDCTVQTHADDFDTVIRYARHKGVKQVFGVGHSYGGPTILRAKEKLDGIVLWDPSHGLSFQEYHSDEYPEKLVGNINIGMAGYGYIEPKAMLDDEKTWGDNSDWALNHNCPFKVISAGNGILKSYGKKYVAAAHEPKQYTKISGAGHLFDDSDEVMIKLFDETTSWLKGIVHGK